MVSKYIVKNALIFLALLILIPVVSAFEFDNVKTYDAQAKTITIKNSIDLLLFNIPTSTIAEYTLFSNTEVKIKKPEFLLAF